MHFAWFYCYSFNVTASYCYFLSRWYLAPETFKCLKKLKKKNTLKYNSTSLELKKLAQNLNSTCMMFYLKNISVCSVVIFLLYLVLSYIWYVFAMELSLSISKKLWSTKPIKVCSTLFVCLSICIHLINKKAILFYFEK